MRRTTGLAGLCFVIGLFVYLTMVDSPDMTTTTADAITFWRDSGHRTQAIIAASLAGLVILVWLYFAAGLVKHLSVAGGEVATRVLLGGAFTFAALLLSCAALFAAPALALTLNNEPVAYDDSLGLATRISTYLGDAILLWMLAFAASAVTAAAAVAGRRAGWPTWTVVVSGLAAIAMLTPLVFFNLMIFLAWCLVLSIRYITATPSAP